MKALRVKTIRMAKNGPDGENMINYEWGIMVDPSRGGVKPIFIDMDGNIISYPYDVRDEAREGAFTVRDI
jgi:hypothetical protein